MLPTAIPGRRLAGTLLLSLGAVARVTGAQTVTGRVVETPGRQPVAEVDVRLLRAAPGDVAPPRDTTPLTTGRTGADGVFALRAPGPGSYRARVGPDTYGPVLTFATADTAAEHEYVLALDYAAPLSELQVDRRAAAVPGTIRPVWPAAVAGTHAAGCAATWFVVDSAGRPEAATVRVPAASHPAFAGAARDALRKARFTPAVRGGRAVRSVARLPVTFVQDGLVAAAAGDRCREAVGAHGLAGVVVVMQRQLR